MSKHIGYYFRCDCCGKEERGDNYSMDGYLISPKNWYTHGKLDYCNECWDLMERAKKAKKQRDFENCILDVD